jgi:hypothetical protein
VAELADLTCSSPPPSTSPYTEPTSPGADFIGATIDALHNIDGSDTASENWSGINEGHQR